ncbi:MAG: fumarate hydratase [Syntrophales bacterium]|nr:fumarate hydratase [Syntrophales bacterium]
MSSVIREIKADSVTETVCKLFLEANFNIREDVLAALRRAFDEEREGHAKEALRIMLENAALAAETSVPICQDTGIAVVFAEIGQDVHVSGGSLKDAIEEGIRLAYRGGYLRKSICNPLTRINTGDNTPGVIYCDIVPGNHIRLVAVPKGGGSENMSALSMLIPAEGRDGIVRFVLDHVRLAGAKACPPYIIGVGIGGTSEEALLIAKKALLEPVGISAGSSEETRELERDILDRVNALGLGPQGFGGRTTCLGVKVAIKPCHIATLPVAVIIQCYAVRQAEAVL